MRFVERARRDDGSTLPLVIFYGVLALALILMVVAASSLYLERKRLFTLADGAALVGAESYDIDDVTLTSGGPRPTLQPDDVAREVRGYIADNPRDDFEALAVDRATTVDGRSATVELSAYWRPPIVGILLPQGFRIDVTAIARSVFD